MANYSEEMGLAWVLAPEPTSDARSLAPINGVLGVTVSSFRVYRPRGTRSYPAARLVTAAMSFS
jgi:hypothetical protein